MNEKLLELTKVVQLRKSLEENIDKAKAEFEDSISTQKEALKDIQDQELILREEAILILESEGKENEVVGDKIITKSVKKTKQITDPGLYREHLAKNKDFYNNLGIDGIEISNEAFQDTVIVKDKKMLDEIISKVENFNGTLPDGVQLKETKFVTISENKQ